MWIITLYSILKTFQFFSGFSSSLFPFFFPEIALQHVSMFFRSEPKWEVAEPLKDIGKKGMCE